MQSAIDPMMEVAGNHSDGRALMLQGMLIRARRRLKCELASVIEARNKWPSERNPIKRRALQVWAESGRDVIADKARGLEECIRAVNSKFMSAGLLHCRVRDDM